MTTSKQPTSKRVQQLQSRKPAPPSSSSASTSTSTSSSSTSPARAAPAKGKAGAKKAQAQAQAQPALKIKLNVTANQAKGAAAPADASGSNGRPARAAAAKSGARMKKAARDIEMGTSPLLMRLNLPSILDSRQHTSSVLYDARMYNFLRVLISREVRSGVLECTSASLAKPGDGLILASYGEESSLQDEKGALM